MSVRSNKYFLKYFRTAPWCFAVCAMASCFRPAPPLEEGDGLSPSFTTQVDPDGSTSMQGHPEVIRRQREKRSPITIIAPPAATNNTTPTVSIETSQPTASEQSNPTPTPTPTPDASHVWMNGANFGAQNGIYGSQGVVSSTNIIGARRYASKAQDNTGHIWVFGGYGRPASSGGFLNDLWEWDGSNWTWMSGSSSGNQLSSYGAKGVALPSNVPGGREGSASWTDSSGNFWLFGGYGYSANGSLDRLNDLWKWDGSQWTWISGKDGTNQAGTYGAKGMASPSNVPGSRMKSAYWTDSLGNFWLFGGSGYGSNGSYTGCLNDLWKWDGSYWTWVAGSNSVGQAGSYGTKGISAATNAPGGRCVTASFFDKMGNFWLFGGEGFGVSGSSGYGWLNDLWKWNGTHWTWVSGSNGINASVNYGVKGVTSASNDPGARSGAMPWVDSSGNFWLFGGSNSSGAHLNDLWKWNGTHWVWMSGSNSPNNVGVFGTKGVGSPDNTPGARVGGISWVDFNGNFWLFGGDVTTAYLNDLWRIFHSP